MFGIFKKKDMKSALNSCQNYYQNIGLGQELTPKELDIVHRMRPFNDIESRYKSHGLTNFGGLAWFSSQVVEGAIKAIESDKNPNQLVLDLADKMAHVCLAIGISVPELKLTKADMGPIEAANQIAIKWVEMTERE